MLDILSVHLDTLHPLVGDVKDFKFGNRSVADIIRSCFPEQLLSSVVICGNFIPSPHIAKLLMGDLPVKVVSPEDKSVVAYNCRESFKEIYLDEKSVLIRYPWDLLRLNEQLLIGLEPSICGDIRERVTIDGIIQLGEGSVILPGVYIEGNAIIGKNCKIGPNCYIRGNTSIGDHCHIGQAVEIKNSILADHVSIGHLSYVGDCIIASDVNFGAGTIVSNLRHDGQNHQYLSDGQLVSTGRRKFGAVIGEGVHTGIHTSIYPGRYLSKGSSTVPGEVVAHSKK